ncbi:MAG: glycoside hydrolase family 3 C-terminal domain-containing protein, partial [Spirochaetales bacterium]|nr:glycoside hydrolase family 3 C-terminal domain-containing protein [Spirochaetales bacterium]
MSEKNMEDGKRKKKNGKAIIVTLSVVVVLAIAVNILMNVFSAHLDLYLGRGKAVVTQAEGTANWDSEYYKSDYSTKAELDKAATSLVSEIESEGIVLLKNNGALPLGGSSNVTLLGRDAADPVYSGSGSGSVDLSSVIDAHTALTEAGFNVNETAFQAIADYAAFSMKLTKTGSSVRVYDHPKANIAMDKPDKSTYYIGEMPVEYYTSDVIASFSDYDDAAILMFGRGGGEGGDLGRDMKGFDDNYVEGQHQLELNKDEKDLLKLAEENFDKVIVLINSSSAMELGDLEDDDQVDAVLWIGSPGQTGFLAVGDILKGAITPSGRTADLYARDFTADPTFVNFGNYQYNNVNKNNAMGDGFFVQYEEGIYYGYRYYETAAVEDFIDYDNAVVYPFGYGLSYTDFDWEVVGSETGKVNGEITVDVKVTNTGSTYSGKDVVQLYFSAPYYEGGIEKPEVVLADFAKTSLLAPGESETLKLRLSVEDMASYDYKDKKAWVLDKGDYEIRIQTDSHNMKDGIEPIIYNVGKTVVYSGDNHRASDFSEVTNRFDDVSVLFSDSKEDGKITNMSRSDFAGTFPTTPKGNDFEATQATIDNFQPYMAFDHEDEDAKMPVTNKPTSLALINFRGLDFDDPLWDELLDAVNP